MKTKWKLLFTFVLAVISTASWSEEIDNGISINLTANSGVGVQIPVYKNVSLLVKPRYDFSKYQQNSVDRTNFHFLGFSLGGRYFNNFESNFLQFYEFEYIGFWIKRDNESFEYNDRNIYRSSWGLQYFMSKKISIEGNVGLELTYSRNDNSLTNRKYGLTAPIYDFGINYYFY